jgi:hypothetical protein
MKLKQQRKKVTPLNIVWVYADVVLLNSQFDLTLILPLILILILMHTPSERDIPFYIVIIILNFLTIK